MRTRLIFIIILLVLPALSHAGKYQVKDDFFIAGYTILNSMDDPVEGVKVTFSAAESDFIDTVITGEDGYFKFSNLTQGEYVITMEKLGYEISKAKIIIMQSSWTFSIEMHPEGIVHGDGCEILGSIWTPALDESGGEPVENVRIKIKGIDRGERHKTKSNNNGFFGFYSINKADIYKLTARKEHIKKKYDIPLEKNMLYILDINWE